jgi:serine/threonine-protein kinase RsbW
MERQFKRHIKSLEAVFQFVNEAFRSYRIDLFYEPAVKLVVEELFTNLVKYNQKSPSEITIGFEKNEKQLILTLTDYGGEEFDITKTEEVDINKPLDERNPGGLGIHLVKKIADQLEYHYTNGESKIIFIKNLE